MQQTLQTTAGSRLGRRSMFMSLMAFGLVSGIPLSALAQQEQAAAPMTQEYGTTTQQPQSGTTMQQGGQTSQAQPGMQQPGTQTQQQTLDPALAKQTGEQIIGRQIVEANGQRFGTIVDVVRDTQTGNLQFVVAHPRVLNIGERYAPLPSSLFRMTGNQLQLTQQVNAEQFKQQARAFHQQAAQFEPVQQNTQLSQLAAQQQQRPAG